MFHNIFLFIIYILDTRVWYIVRHVVLSYPSHIRTQTDMLTASRYLTTMRATEVNTFNMQYICFFIISLNEFFSPATTKIMINSLMQFLSYDNNKDDDDDVWWSSLFWWLFYDINRLVIGHSMSLKCRLFFTRSKYTFVWIYIFWMTWMTSLDLFFILLFRIFCSHDKNFKIMYRDEKCLEWTIELPYHMMKIMYVLFWGKYIRKTCFIFNLINLVFTYIE